MNIDQLAARLAKLPRPEWAREQTDADWLDVWRSVATILLCKYVREMLDAATSYPVVRWQDIKPGEYYWVRLEHGQRWAMWDLRDLRLSMRNIIEAVEIRGPIPRPE